MDVPDGFTVVVVAIVVVVAVVVGAVVVVVVVVVVAVVVDGQMVTCKRTLASILIFNAMRIYARLEEGMMCLCSVKMCGLTVDV